MGVLRERCPYPLSAEAEAWLLERFKAKMAGPVGLYVQAVRAAVEAYGPGARQAIRGYRSPSPGPVPDRPASESLRDFCRQLEDACVGSHEWEKLEDSDTRQAYRFTRCAWAELFRALGAEDIGIWICEGDGPAAAAFDPRIGFQRTRTLMAGDDCCDHVYYVAG